MSLKFAVLGLLSSTGAQSGYDIKQRFSVGVRNIWEADLSQIYRMLDRLEHEELVVSEPDPDSNRGRRVYEITSNGRDQLQAWLEEDYELAVVRDPALVRLFFAARLVSPERVKQQIRDYRQKFVELTNGYEGVESYLDTYVAAGNADALFQQFTLNLGKRYTQMTIEWCDDVLQQLDHFTNNDNDK